MLDVAYGNTATSFAMLRDVAYDIVCDAASDVTRALIRLISPLRASSNNVPRGKG